MNSHFELSDQEFESQFKSCELIPTLFSHKAHIRLAWIHINKYGVERAVDNLCSQIKKFDATHDDGTKYHTTITVAAVKAVYHFTLKSKTTSFKDFIAENPRLITNFKDLIDTHYGFSIFSSEKAKKEYLEPDLVPFD